MKLKFNTILEKPERIFLILGAFFGLTSVFLMPALTIPDEGAHFWVSYGMFSKNKQVPQGLLVSAEDSASYIKKGTYVKNIFQDRIDFEGDSFQFNFAKGIVLNDANSDRSVSSFDISRLPQAIGIKMGQLIYPSLGVMTITGRLVNLAFFLTAIYLIIRRVTYGKLAFTFLALFPMIIHQAASLSYDVVNIVVIFAWLALMINLFTQKTTVTKKQLILVASLGIALTMTKPTNMLLFGYVPFLPSKLYKNTRLFAVLSSRLPKFSLSRRSLKLLVGSLLALILIAATFFIDAYLDKHGIGTTKFSRVFFNTFFRTDINTQLDPIVTTGIVGHFSWLWYKLPEWLVIIHLSVFGLILLGDKVPNVSLRFAMLSVSIFVLSVLAITLGMYLMWTLQPFVAGPSATFIQGMQGRYFTPLLVLLIPLFAYLQRFISIRVKAKLLGVLAIAIATFSLTVYLLLTYLFFYQST